MSSVAHGPAMCTPRIGPPRSGDDLHHAVGLAHDERAAVAHPAVHRGLDVVAALLGLRLGETAERDLGMAVDAPRDLVVVERERRFAEHRLDRDDRLRERDVRELRRGHDVADRVDAVDARAHVAVDDDETALVDLDARPRRGRCSPIGAGGRPTRRPCRRAAAALRPSWSRSGRSRSANPSTRTSGVRLDAALLERAHDRLRDLLVDAARGSAGAPRGSSPRCRRRRRTTRTRIRSRRRR